MMICKQLDNKFDWLGLLHGLVYPILVVAFGWMGQDKIGEPMKNIWSLLEALGMQNRSINVWDGSELKLAWSNKSSSYFENNFAIFLLSVISNTSIFKELDVLRLVATSIWTRNISIHFISCLFSNIANKFY